MPLETIISPPQVIKSCFSSDDLGKLNPLRMPKHIAVIPDGNRRWAKKHFSSAQEGHKEGADTLTNIIKAARELQIETLTIFAFSTENWNRSPEEVLGLMLLYASYLTTERETMIEDGVKLHTIGNLASLPEFLQEIIQDTKELTKECNQLNLVLAFNYGSRNEICRAFISILDDYDQKLLLRKDINEETISNYLDTHLWSDPDLLIRTSGENRVSNFLLWQISYAEIHLAPVLWPDFTPKHFLEAIFDYQSRDRRWGGG